MSFKKFYSINRLAPIIKEKRKIGCAVALANGGFDLIHIGHIRYLHAAKAMADILVVALNSDSSLARLKGQNRPLIDEEGRVNMISAVQCVDYVTLFDEERVDKVLLILKPDFHCKGSDYRVDTVPERDMVRRIGATTAIVGGEKIRSTSEIIQRIRELYG